MENIVRGATWDFEMKAWTDQTRTTPVALDGHTFVFKLETQNGTVALTKNNAAFVQQADTNHRKLVLTDMETAALARGTYMGRIYATLPDTTVERWVNEVITVD